MDTTLKFAQDVVFLALVTWREARGEPHLGKIAVAQSVLNRVRRPSWWGNSVLAVITKKWQYSSMTDPHDLQLDTWPREDDVRWHECMSIARGCLDGSLDNPAPGADSYFADTIAPPRWADPKKFVVKIGHHAFYNLDSDYER